MRKLIYVLVVLVLGLALFSKEVKAQEDGEGGTFQCFCNDSIVDDNFTASCVEWSVRINNCEEGYEPNLTRCSTDTNECASFGSCYKPCDPIGSVTPLDWGETCDRDDLSTQCEAGTGCRMDANDTYRCLKDLNSLSENEPCEDLTECRGYAEQNTLTTISCSSNVCRHTEIDSETETLPITCTTSEGLNGVYSAIGCIPIETNVSMWTFILRWAIGLAGGIAFLLILYAGFLLITSAGHPKKIQAGKELLYSAITGLILLIFSVWLLRIIGADILGIFQ